MKTSSYKTSKSKIIFKIKKDQTKISIINDNNIITAKIPFDYLFDIVYNQAIELYKLGKNENPGINRRVLAILNGNNAEVSRIDPNRVKHEYILFKEDELK